FPALYDKQAEQASRKRLEGIERIETVPVDRTVRYGWLGQHLFTSLDELQNYATQWQWFYNHERPNMALNGFTPMQHIQHMT
ncbi:integrase core domain-containing protein, partial [Yersinia enterocolitica]